jgi:hypothetical protein
VLWAVYERDRAAGAPPEVGPDGSAPISIDDPQLLEAMRLQHLNWAD